MGPAAKEDARPQIKHMMGSLTGSSEDAMDYWKATIETKSKARRSCGSAADMYGSSFSHTYVCVRAAARAGVCVCVCVCLSFSVFVQVYVYDCLTWSSAS